MSPVPLLVMVTSGLGQAVQLLCKGTFTPFVIDKYLPTRCSELVQKPSTHHTFSYQFYYLWVILASNKYYQGGFQMLIYFLTPSLLFKFLIAKKKNSFSPLFHLSIISRQVHEFFCYFLDYNPFLPVFILLLQGS